MLTPAFLQALDAADELIVTSREDGRERSVRAWFVVGAPDAIYLFNYAFAHRVRRWRKDPWVRLTIPGSRLSVEGLVRFVGPDELSPELTELVVDRWGMWGATTASGLRRMLLDGTHALVRVDLHPDAPPRGGGTS